MYLKGGLTSKDMILSCPEVSTTIVVIGSCCHCSLKCDWEVYLRICLCLVRRKYCSSGIVVLWLCGLEVWGESIVKIRNMGLV